MGFINNFTSNTFLLYEVNVLGKNVLVEYVECDENRDEQNHNY